MVSFYYLAYSPSCSRNSICSTLRKSLSSSSYPFFSKNMGSESMPREKSTRIIPLAPIDRLIRRAGAARVSEHAASELGEVLEELGIEIAEIAKELSEFAGRKTVTRKDVKLAYKQWKKIRR